jgi:hypothetical protein
MEIFYVLINFSGIEAQTHEIYQFSLVVCRIDHNIDIHCIQSNMNIHMIYVCV